MKRPAVLLLLLGVVAALLAGALVFFVGTSLGAGAAPPPVAVVAPTATPLPLEQVVVAAKDIPMRHVVDATDVVTRSFPIGVAPADVTHVLSDVISHTATIPILAGEMLVNRQFLDAGGLQGASTTVPPGKILVAFPATDMLNSTLAVRAGDHVDILITLPVSGTTTVNSSESPQQEAGGGKLQVTQATMQNIEIYSTGVWTPAAGTTGASGAGGGSTGAAGEGIKVITFIVDHQEALILKFIKDSGGTIDLGVRSIADKNAFPTDPVSLDYLVDLYHLVQAPTR
jgi:pilus assembly protein CpaB